METESPVHVLIVAGTGQGNINPMFRLGKLLASKGLLVTLSTPESVGKNIKATNGSFTDQPTPIGDGFIRFETFNDHWEAYHVPRLGDAERYLLHVEQASKKSIPLLIAENAKRGLPISCLINNPLNPWVIDVAESLGLPIAMFWIQSCACFAAYYHYFHDLVPFPDERNPEKDVQLPCMPLLKSDQVPTFLHPTTRHPYLRRNIMSTFKKLDKPFCVLMETFQELEPEIIEYMSKLCPFKAIGPLFKHPEVQNASLHSDLIKAEDCIEWLDTKPPFSVVYISFGSVAHLEQDQWNEIAHGILNSGVTFLLVIKPQPKSLDQVPLPSPKWLLEQAGEKGKIVQWCPQEKVFAHPSVACFVTHCGWNSCVEALTYGVPVVTFPMWGDQVTNAKYLVDVFKVGVSVCVAEKAEKKLVTSDELKRCLSEVTVGAKNAEMKQNALKWKALCEAAVSKGGPSDLNIQAFVEEVKKRSVRNVTCKST